jgi:hypothetical protein
MRYWSAFLALCALLLVAAGLRGLLLARAVVPPGPEALLRQATAIRIGYTVGEQRRHVTVSRPEELRRLLDALTVTSTIRRTDFPSWQARGSADFTLPNGTVLRTVFVYNDQLERLHWGRLYVTQDFYRKICDLLTREEGRPIDVLKNNP